MTDARGSLALACGLLVVTIAVAARPTRPRTLVVGRIVELEPDRMSLDVEYADPASTVRRLEIAYRGPLAPNVCRGHDVAVTGVSDGATLAADEITPVNMGRYDPCFRWRCFPALCPSSRQFH